MNEEFRVRQPGGTIVLRFPDRELLVEPDGRDAREVCCLDKAVAVLRANARQQEIVAARPTI